MSLLLATFVATTCAIYGSGSAGPSHQHEGTYCPDGYKYVNGLCYGLCPPDRFQHTDGLCYPKITPPCPNVDSLSTPSTNTATLPTPVPTTTTTTTTTPPTTTPTVIKDYNDEAPLPPLLEPQAEELAQCPAGSIFVNNQCRKLLCTRGEYISGRCVQPLCKEGLVWRGKRCQPPAYLTTVLEIENVITNRKEYTLVTENVNNVEQVTVPPYNPGNNQSYNAEVLPPSALVDPTSTTRRPPTTTVRVPEPNYDDNAVPSDGCCVVKSPRICRNYAPKWVCFNRSKKLCDPRVCKRPTIYLKPPRMEYNPELGCLIMPPNPPLSACMTADCNESDYIDCSGCAQNRRENCSSSCFNYFCPNGNCQFMNSEDYCKLYPGSFGCTQSDCRLSDWCSKNVY
ncbi:mucin-2 [Scaptodrosophila lebanonensis]|uniref:Mucin-2 n=1 Tax=Drosophila lebanonensis TaxID=7225 RepID=A0A6J2TCT8_DROLE|nr:mucin-2 [Scaptodrosophila lebanonensis]